MNVFTAIASPIVDRPGAAIERPAAPKRKMPGRIVLPYVSNPWGLTPMLCEVLRRTVRGETAKEIAYALGRSPRTVECHVARIVERMRVRSLLQAALLWDRQFREETT